MRYFSVLLGMAASLSAQEFDAASIKPSQQLRDGAIRIGPPTGGPGSTDPTHYTWPSATLQAMLQRAYDVKAYQVSGPDWIRTERFDIAVALPEGTTKEQFAMMWRNLLATRFGVKLRVEKKEFAVDELVIGSRGHKLQETANPAAAPLTPPSAGGSLFGKDGKLNGAGMVTMMESRPTGVTGRVMAVAQPLSGLADLLGNQLGHPVLDKTGLTGKYDFTVEYVPEVRGLVPATPLGGGTAATPTAPVAADVGMDLATAVQQQLGLRLEKGRGLLDYVVVEQAEKVPSEN